MQTPEIMPIGKPKFPNLDMNNETLISDMIKNKVDKNNLDPTVRISSESRIRRLKDTDRVITINIERMIVTPEMTSRKLVEGTRKDWPNKIAEGINPNKAKARIVVPFEPATRFVN